MSEEKQAPERRIHWRYVETKKPKTVVIQPAKPDSAKRDLQRFVERNQLRYQRVHEDSLTDFERLFDRLNLNNDDELLDRAERRDLPSKIQLLCRQPDSQQSPRSDFRGQR